MTAEGPDEGAARGGSRSPGESATDTDADDQTAEAPQDEQSPDGAATDESSGREQEQSADPATDDDGGSARTPEGGEARGRADSAGGQSWSGDRSRGERDGAEAPDRGRDRPWSRSGTGEDNSEPTDRTTGMASSDDSDGSAGGHGGSEPRSADGGNREDPLDVTEADLDTSDVDDEDLDRLVELLDEARDDPDAVEGRDLEDMLTVFDDAGIDTTNLEAVDLEERFDESLKVARILVTAAANTSEYAGLAGLRAGSRMAEAAFTSESPRDLLEETTDIARDELDRLGLPFGSAGRNGTSPDRDSNGGESDGGPVTVRDLRRRGERLLDLSADVDHEEPFHPAYVRVVEQLSADEARILRLLATEGPQPALDVRDLGLLPFGRGTPVAEDLTMLDTDAGLRYEDRSDIYTENLQRLGLLEVTDTALERLEQYRVLQAQPRVEAAQERASRPTTVRRSVRLSAMGIDLCRTVFSFDLAEQYDPGSDSDG
jgi:hypothetical protein